MIVRRLSSGTSETNDVDHEAEQQSPIHGLPIGGFSDWSMFARRGLFPRDEPLAYHLFVLCDQGLANLLPSVEPLVLLVL